MSYICVRAECCAGLTDDVLAGVAVCGDCDGWVQYAEMGHVVTIEIL